MLGNVYLITGQPNTGKSVLASRMHALLKTEKRNWRRGVFLFDENTHVLDYSKIDAIVQYIHQSGFDIVIAATYPKVSDRMLIRSVVRACNLKEVYLYCTVPKRVTQNIADYENPIDDGIIRICTNRLNVDMAYNELINMVSGEDGSV